MKLPFYAAEYEGEFIIHSTIIKDGQREEEREWVPATLDNNDHRGNAVIIGNGDSREKFDLRLLAKHKGGLFASLKLQSYGCNALYRDFSPDFLVCNTPVMMEEIVQTDYCSKNIVYSSAALMVKYPGKFHLVPQNYTMNAGAVATYLAAFHEHANIYLIGFDNQQAEGYNNNRYAGTNAYKNNDENVTSIKWEANMKRIFDAYLDTTFHYIHPNADYICPDPWKWCKNLKLKNYRDYISELDIG
jgi:hypothetical protein